RLNIPSFFPSSDVTGFCKYPAGENRMLSSRPGARAGNVLNPKQTWTKLNSTRKAAWRRWLWVLGFALLVQDVTAASGSDILMTSAPNPSGLSQPVLLSAFVSPPSAKGKVTFYEGTTVLGIAEVANGKANLNTILLPTGAGSLRAYYSGDSSNAA